MSKPVQTISAVPSCDGVKKKEHCEHHAECMKLIQMLLDGETTPEETLRIRQNIGKCIPCENGYSLEKSIKEALQLRINKMPVPTTLLTSIREKLFK